MPIVSPRYIFFCLSFFTLLTSAVFFPSVRSSLAAVSNTATNLVISILNATSDNLLRNSSFESESGGKPRQWNHQLDSTSGNTFRSAEGIRSGSYGLKFKGEGNGNLGISQPDVKTTPQRTYTFSTYIKVVNAPKVTVRIGFWDEYNNKRGTMKDFTFTGTKDWSRIHMTTTTPGTITDHKNWFPMIEILGLKSGSIYIDDVKLEEGNVLTAYNTASAKTSHTSLGDGSILSSTDGDLYPAQSGVGSLGLSNNKWEDLFISDDASIGDELSVSGNLDVTGNITIKGTQTVTGGTTISGSQTVSGDLAINGGDLTSTATTFNLLNSTVTTLNLAGAATTLSIGASSGTTTINNSLTVSGISVTLPAGSVAVSELADAAKPKTGATQIVCASDAKDTTRCDRVGDGTNDEVAIQAALDALPISGGSVVLSEGTFEIRDTITLKSGHGLIGQGRQVTVLQARGTVSVVVGSDNSVSGQIQRITIRDLRIRGTATIGDRGIQLKGVDQSYFANLHIDDFGKTDAICIELTSWNDNGTWRYTRDTTWVAVEADGFNGVKLTKDPADPATFGSNANSFFGLRVYAYKGIGIDIDAGEGNAFYAPRATTSQSNTTGIRVNDDVNLLSMATADASAGNNTIGIDITAEANGTVVIIPGGDGTDTRWRDNGLNTIGFRRNALTKNGTTTIPSGSTSIAVAYGSDMFASPSAEGITVTPTNNPTNDPGNIWITDISISGFTVKVRNDPGATGLNLSWAANATPL